MKYLILLFFAFLLFACSSSKRVYWCGDHACINNKEKESYFKKTMIVEVRELKKRSNKDQSKLERIKKQAGLEDKNKVENDKVLNKQSYSEKNKAIKEEKRLAKQIRLDEKKRIKEEIRLTKQIRLEEKKRIKEEKRLTKQVRLEEKKRIKEEKRLTKQVRLEEKKVNKNKISKKQILNTENFSVKEKIAIDDVNAIVDTSSSEFNELVEKITRKNMSKSYPNINDIPN